jgi:hypothetical protein
MTTGRLPSVEGGIQPTIFDAAGDLLYAVSADTPARLGIGSTGNVLTVAGGVPTWSAPAAAGGITLISETVASAISSLTLGSIPQTYKQLYLTWSGIQHSATLNFFRLRLNNESSSIYQTKAFQSSFSGGPTNRFQNFGNVGSNSTYSFGAYTNTADVYDQAAGYLLINNYASTTKGKDYNYNYAYKDISTPSTESEVGIGLFASNTAITSIDIYRVSGTGTFSNSSNTSIRLYGIS